jgi:serine/threonine-protein kinase/endoribonuclease IRE1
MKVFLPKYLFQGLVATLSRYRKYDGESLQDLMRVIRNKKNHYSELPPDVRGRIGSLPDGYLAYFDSLFPNLLVYIYQLVCDHPFLIEEDVFKPYFPDSVV